MTKRRDEVAELMAAIRHSFDARRENTSRYESDGSLKPLCAPDQHKPLGKSTRCEKCGLIVRGDGANLQLTKAPISPTAGHAEPLISLYPLQVPPSRALVAVP